MAQRSHPAEQTVQVQAPAVGKTLAPTVDRRNAGTVELVGRRRSKPTPGWNIGDTGEPGRVALAQCRGELSRQLEPDNDPLSNT